MKSVHEVHSITYKHVPQSLTPTKCPGLFVLTLNNTFHFIYHILKRF